MNALVSDSEPITLPASARRRSHIAQAMARAGGGIAILPTAAVQMRNGDSEFTYRHDSHFHYLTGFAEPQAWLVVTSEGRSILFCRPRVWILSTGDELAEPGMAAERAGAIPESVSLGVAALTGDWGGSIVNRQRLRDDLPSMERAAAQAIASSDLVLVTGGASVGEKDFAKAMFGPAALSLIFSKVAIKPGKPVWFGRSGGTLVMGLPGNPTSALVTARLLLAPLLGGLSGRDPREALRWRSARLKSALRDCGPRETFHRARWSGNDVEVFAFQDSSAQKVLADADLLVRQNANSPDIHAGDEIRALDF